ncbi:MAG: SPOR domain-containing protein [Vicinamibacterales bacterium]
MPSSPDDGFREIQLSGKQLVFLFMAATIVLVVTFLTGVLVGRGVRAERMDTSNADLLNESPQAPERFAVQPPTDDPTTAPPPAPQDEEPAAKAPAVPDEQPPEAVPRNEPVPAATGTPAADSLRAPSKPAPEVTRPVPAKAEPAKAAPAKAVPAKAEPAKAAPPSAPPSVGGYAVQVVAVNVRGEADAIVRRLASKSYAAYVETPKGNSAVFRVRVGPFKTRREAQAMADRLKREEKFKPWVTR